MSSKQQFNNSQLKRKILVTGGRFDVEQCPRKRALKTAHCKSKTFPGATTETILEKLENLLESKPDMLIVHAGTYDLPKYINSLHNLRKVYRKCLEL